MINLTDFENYFTEIATRVGCKRVFFFTSESDIKDYVHDITPEEQPILVAIIPSSTTKGSSQDELTETNTALLYVLSKEERGERTTFGIQKALQPIFEQLKKTMTADKDGCGIMRGLDVSSLASDPESKLFSHLTGWSLQFDVETE